MATFSTWSVNDLSARGVNTAAANPSSGANAQYGNIIQSGFTTYSAAFAALPGLRAANPGTNLQIVRQDVIDGAAVQYDVQVSI